MNVKRMRSGNTHWDYDGDGVFDQYKEFSIIGRRYARKWWIKQLKKRMDE